MERVAEVEDNRDSINSVRHSYNFHKANLSQVVRSMTSYIPHRKRIAIVLAYNEHTRTLWFDEISHIADKMDRRSHLLFIHIQLKNSRSESELILFLPVAAQSY